MQMRHLLAGGLIVVGLGAAATHPGFAADPAPPSDTAVRVTAGPTPRPEPISTLAPRPTAPPAPAAGAPEMPLDGAPAAAPPPPARVVATPEPLAPQLENGVGTDAAGDGTPTAAADASGASGVLDTEPTPKVLAATGSSAAFAVLGLASLAIGLAWVAVGRRPRDAAPAA